MATKRPSLVKLSKLKEIIYREVIRVGSVSGVVSYNESYRGQDGSVTIDRNYNFLGLQAKTSNCTYDNKREVEAEALDDCIGDLKGRPADLETRVPGQPLWPHTIEASIRNSNSMNILVKKYVPGQIRQN